MPMPGATSAVIGMWAAVGGRHETPERNGVCHFIEHMLFKGTRKRSARELTAAIEGVGGYLNGFTSEEHTCFFARVSGRRFPLAFQVLSDMYLRSAFDPAELEKERAVIQEEIAMYLDRPHHRVQELVSKTLWPDHPLGRPLTGTRETVGALRREDLLRFYRETYTASNTAVAVAGAVDPETALAAAEKLDRALRKGRPIAFLPATDRPQGPRLRVERMKTEQAQIALGFRTGSRHDPRRHALRLLNVALGENMSSRLFVRLREERGLVYSVHSSLSFYEDAGDLVISLGLDPRNVQPALELIVEELRQLRRAPLPRSEFARAREYVLGQMDLSLESVENRMLWLGEQMLGYRRVRSAEEIKEEVLAVRPKTAWELAAEVFRKENLFAAAVAPVPASREWRKILERL